MCFIRSLATIKQNQKSYKTHPSGSMTYLDWWSNNMISVSTESSGTYRGEKKHTQVVFVLHLVTVPHMWRHCGFSGLWKVRSGYS